MEERSEEIGCAVVVGVFYQC